MAHLRPASQSDSGQDPARPGLFSMAAPWMPSGPACLHLWQKQAWLAASEMAQGAASLAAAVGAALAAAAAAAALKPC